MNNSVIVMEKKPVRSGSERTEEGLCSSGRPELVPVRGNLTRIINKFENTNPIKQAGVIKNYIYVEQKRILA